MDKIVSMPVSKLLFDKRNPRLVEFSEINPKTTEKEVIEILWETMDVMELVLSIAARGYFKNEPLVVSNETGKSVVIEGNRRLAAVKIILDPTLIDAVIPHVEQSIKESLRELPVMIATRKEAWQYVGFKHVNGPAKWGSFAKAKYVAQVHNDFQVPLDQISRQIGDTHRTVQRLYRGLMVIEQAENEKLFSREDIKKSHFAFSHLYTGLQYNGFSQFLDLKDEVDETKEFVPKNKLNELKEVCLWLYGSKRGKIEPVVQLQNPHLRQLDEILQSREAIAALRDGVTIESAFELTKPVQNIFEEELLKAKRSLVKAKGLVTEGYDGSGGLLQIVAGISNIAYDLHEEMQRKQSPGIKRVPMGQG
ncbi:MAG: hypothetical protein GY757_10550 [bacterium]|nr:hypothetical protein [bacterium]